MHPAAAQFVNSHPDESVTGLAVTIAGLALNKFCSTLARFWVTVTPFCCSCGSMTAYFPERSNACLPFPTGAWVGEPSFVAIVLFSGSGLFLSTMARAGDEIGRPGSPSRTRSGLSWARYSRMGGCGVCAASAVAWGVVMVESGLIWK